MDNLIKCPLCEKQIIIDEYRSHQCPSKIIDVITIGIDADYGYALDKNDDEVQLVKTVEGKILRLVKCKHQIPHNLPSNRGLTGENSNLRDNTSPDRYIYKVLVPYHTVRWTN